MDPNNCLSLLRTELTNYNAANERAASFDDDDFFSNAACDARDAREWHASFAVSYAEALIDWLDKGGFLPDAWRPESTDEDDQPDNLVTIQLAHDENDPGELVEWALETLGNHPSVLFVGAVLRETE